MESIRQLKIKRTKAFFHDIDMIFIFICIIFLFNIIAAQFVDLLGYFSIKILQDEKKIQNFVQEAVNVLKSQNTILAMHPNSSIYGSLSQLVEFNGYFLWIRYYTLLLNVGKQW